MATHVESSPATRGGSNFHSWKEKTVCFKADSRNFCLGACLAGILIWTCHGPSLPPSWGADQEQVGKRIAAKFYVTPDGDDQASGSIEAPFRTVTRAQQAIRELKKNQPIHGDVAVVLRQGTYFLDSTLRFTAEDSGTEDYHVIFEAAEGEQVVLSGGRLVQGWKQRHDGLWEATCNLQPFRQLYVGGKRAVRARSGKLGDDPDPSRWEFLHDFSREGGLPNAEFLHAEGFTSSAVEMAAWGNPQEIEFIFVNIWSLMRYKVRELRREGDALVVLMQQPQFYHGRFKEGVTVNMPAWIENALELLDEPGEWYFDPYQKVLFYRPRAGEDSDSVPVVAPQLERLMVIAGDVGRPVRNLIFRGLVFTESNWAYPNQVGHADVQANFTLDSADPRLMVRVGGFTMVHNELRKSPGAILLRYAEGIRFENCTFTRLGSAGVDIECGSRRNCLVGCHFYDISGSAIQIGDVQRDDHHPDDQRKIVSENTVQNCVIHDCALEYMGGVGIFVGYTTRTQLLHNEICRLPYTGISVGWGWGEEDAGGGVDHYWQPFRFTTPTPSRENLIAFNHIHHVMRPMQDGGAVYTLGNQPGTVIRGNYIHDCAGGPGGIYLDEGSGFIEVTENVIHDVPKPINFNNHAQNRISTCKVHENYTRATRPKRFGPEETAIMNKAGLEAPYRGLLRHIPEIRE
jgi:hypothetical protein